MCYAVVNSMQGEESMGVLQVGTVRLAGEWLRYYLLRGLEPQGGYGICVTCGEDAAFVPEISCSETKIRQLLHSMMKGRVTPVTARDVIEDWLCGQ